MPAIERRGPLTEEEFTECYGMPGRPVVIEGATENWPCRTRWTLDFLEQHCGADVVTVKEPATGQLRDTTFREYMAYARTTPDVLSLREVVRPTYLSSWKFWQGHPDMMADFVLPPYFADDWLAGLPQRIRMLWIFLGPAGTGSSLHVDPALTSAWNAQLVGHKRWIMFPPEASAAVYHGAVNPFHPDLERFPRFGEWEPYTAEVGPGDLVFTPSQWWHATLNLDLGSALTGNFLNATNVRAALEFLERIGGLPQAPGPRAMAQSFLDLYRDRLPRARHMGCPLKLQRLADFY